jgi:hypothetical protein
LRALVFPEAAAAWVETREEHGAATIEAFAAHFDLPLADVYAAIGGLAAQGPESLSGGLCARFLKELTWTPELDTILPDGFMAWHPDLQKRRSAAEKARRTLSTPVR